jgi:hypothetical protein
LWETTLRSGGHCRRFNIQSWAFLRKRENGLKQHGELRKTPTLPVVEGKWKRKRSQHLKSLYEKSHVQ